MALIYCSECKKEISNTAKTCPNCGAPVVIDFDKSIEEDKAWTYISNFFRGLLIIIIIIFAFSYFTNNKKENVITHSSNNSKKSDDKSRIIKPTKTQIQGIVDGFKPTLIAEKSCAIKSKDYDNVYFVALRLSKYYKSWGEKQDIGVGVWALGGSGGPCYSANDLAATYSLYPKTIVSMYDEGALTVKKHITSGKGFNIPKEWINELKEQQARQKEEIQENKRILREKGITID